MFITGLGPDPYSMVDLLLYLVISHKVSLGGNHQTPKFTGTSPQCYNPGKIKRRSCDFEDFKEKLVL